MSKSHLAAVTLPAILLSLIAGCGVGPNRVLESISISPNTAAGATASYTTTGTTTPRR